MPTICGLGGWLASPLVATAPSTATPPQWEALKVRLDTLLGTLEMPVVLVVAAIGLISLTLGWKFYRVLVVLFAAAAGALVGDLIAGATNEQISASGWYPIAMWVAGALSFGAIAIPYLRFGLFVVSGAIGAYGMFIAAQALAPGYALLFSMVGFVVVGGVALAFFQLIVVLGTSLIGAVGLVLPSLWFLRGYAPDTYEWLLANMGLLPAATLVVGLVGVIIQLQMIPDSGVQPPTGRSSDGGGHGGLDDHSGGQHPSGRPAAAGSDAAAATGGDRRH